MRYIMWLTLVFVPKLRNPFKANRKQIRNLNNTLKINKTREVEKTNVRQFSQVKNGNSANPTRRKEVNKLMESGTNQINTSAPED